MNHVVYSGTRSLAALHINTNAQASCPLCLARVLGRYERSGTVLSSSPCVSRVYELYWKRAGTLEQFFLNHSIDCSVFIKQP